MTIKKLKRLYLRLVALFKPKCNHLISLNKMCWMRRSRGKTIVYVVCDHCSDVIQVEADNKWDKEYIEKINKICRSY